LCYQSQERKNNAKERKSFGAPKLLRETLFMRVLSFSDIKIYSGNHKGFAPTSGYGRIPKKRVIINLGDPQNNIH